LIVSSCKYQRSQKSVPSWGSPKAAPLIKRVYERPCFASVTFDANSQLSHLEQFAFRESGLQSIHLPGSLEVICESCFSSYTSLVYVIFDANSRLSRPDKEAFYGSGLQSIHFPGSLKGSLSFSHFIKGLSQYRFSVCNLSYKIDTDEVRALFARTG
jgi:hypothetical protein